MMESVRLKEMVFTTIARELQFWTRTEDASTKTFCPVYLPELGIFLMSNSYAFNNPSLVAVEIESPLVQVASRDHSHQLAHH